MTKDAIRTLLSNDLRQIVAAGLVGTGVDSKLPPEVFLALEAAEAIPPDAEIVRSR